MQNEFDVVAKSYDADFSNSEIGKLQRKIVWKYLEKRGIHHKRIIEINCGTGEDAVKLAEKGNSVSATDASEEMLSITRNKLVKIGAASSETFRWNLYDAFPFPGKKYDLVFSNFGGLNCISPKRLKELNTEFVKLLNENGQLIFIVMGRFCLWETIYFLLKGKWKAAFRRRSKHAVKARLHKDTFVDTWYYSPKELKKIFSTHFIYSTKKPVGIVIPPSYLEMFFKKNKQLLRFFSVLDRFLSTVNLLSGLSDHYIIQLEKQ